MANPWDADIVLSQEDALHLVREQFPDLCRDSFRLLSSGWDNDAYLVDDRVIFRFPRRRVAAALIENEIRILPLLAPYLSLPISVSSYVGKSTGAYPYVWAGYNCVPGQTACRISWTDSERAANAERLGQFLRDLHSIPISQETRQWAPGDEIARTDYVSRLPKVQDRLEQLRSIFPDIDISKLQEMSEELARAARWSGESCWVHGDLYSRHIVANDRREVVGVIDWGDVHIGDRALDLSIAFTFLPQLAHDVFRVAYGGCDEQTWNNAKFRAISHAAAISDYALGIKDKDLLRAAKFTLRSMTG
jgi:aminoglycoside phosphotransferase (APT) family kinase protein